MKRLFSTLLMISALSVSVCAQTEFRHISLDEAKAAAKSEGKKIFIDFYTQWCGPCKRMARDVFPDKEVGDFLNNGYVCLKLDAEAEGEEAANHYGVSAYPTLMVLDADGHKISDYAGMKMPSDFLAMLKQWENPELTTERVVARYEQGERDAALVDAYARYLIENTRDYREGYFKASNIVNEYFQSLAADDLLKEENMFIFLSYPVPYGTPTHLFLEENISRFSQSAQDKLQDVIHQAYSSATMGFLMNDFLRREPDGVAEFKTLRENAARHGYDRELEPAFSFIEKRGACNDSDYLAYCEKNLGKLTSDQQGAIIQSLANTCDLTTQGNKQMVIGFIRRNIGSLPVSTMYSALQTLGDLEE